MIMAFLIVYPLGVLRMFSINVSTLLYDDKKIDNVFFQKYSLFQTYYDNVDENKSVFSHIKGIYWFNIGKIMFIWTTSGLEIIEIEADSALSYFDVCSDRSIFERNIYVNRFLLPGVISYTEWKNNIRLGNYIDTTTSRGRLLKKVISLSSVNGIPSVRDNTGSITYECKEK